MYKCFYSIQWSEWQDTFAFEGKSTCVFKGALRHREKDCPLLCNEWVEMDEAGAKSVSVEAAVFEP